MSSARERRILKPNGGGWSTIRIVAPNSEAKPAKDVVTESLAPPTRNPIVTREEVWFEGGVLVATGRASAPSTEQAPHKVCHHKLTGLIDTPLTPYQRTSKLASETSKTGVESSKRGISMNKKPHQSKQPVSDAKKQVRDAVRQYRIENGLCCYDGCNETITTCKALARKKERAARIEK